MAKGINVYISVFLLRTAIRVLAPEGGVHVINAGPSRALICVNERQRNMLLAARVKWSLV